MGFAIVAPLVATLCPTARAPQVASATKSAAEAKHSIARKLSLEGVPNFGEVTPTLYRGAQPTKEGFRNLAEMGIRTVVDLRGSRQGERDEVTRLGMQYVAIPWRCFHPKDRVIAQFLTLLRENAGKKVFVHCRTGDDRTGMEVAAFRIANQGWTAEEARKEMEVFGFSLFHRTICPGLASYEKNFTERFKTSPAFANLRPTENTSAPRPD